MTQNQLSSNFLPTFLRLSSEPSSRILKWISLHISIKFFLHNQCDVKQRETKHLTSLIFIFAVEKAEKDKKSTFLRLSSNFPQTFLRALRSIFEADFAPQIIKILSTQSVCRKATRNTTFEIAHIHFCG